MENFELNENRMSVAQESGAETHREKSNSARISLTKRDFEILRFLLEMKFASLDEIYFRFFRVRLDGKDSQSAWWARERLSLLKKAGFLEAVKFYTESKTYFVPTWSAYRAVANRFPVVIPCRPLSKFDFRHFDHDKHLLWLRLDLESRGMAYRWLSDRYLAQDTFYSKTLSREIRPDAIYRSLDDQKIAFEVEIALKARSRYREKIQAYVRIMRSTGDAKFFERAVFVCIRDSVRKILDEETRIFGELFSVRSVGDFDLARIENASKVAVQNQIEMDFSK